MDETGLREELAAIHRMYENFSVPCPKYLWGDREGQRLESLKVKVATGVQVPFLVMEEDRDRAVHTLTAPFRRDEPRHIRRILDLGAGYGEWSMWASIQWSRAWIDCVELDPIKKRLLRRNLPHGAEVIEYNDAHVNAFAYDVIRVTSAEMFWKLSADGYPQWANKCTRFIVDISRG